MINWTASKERLKAYTKLNFQLLSLPNDRSDANTTIRFQNYFCYCADVFWFLFCFCLFFFYWPMPWIGFSACLQRADYHQNISKQVSLRINKALSFNAMKASVKKCLNQKVSPSPVEKGLFFIFFTETQIHQVNFNRQN